MLRRCWDLRNIPCEASSVSDHDDFCRGRLRNTHISQAPKLSRITSSSRLRVKTKRSHAKARRNPSQTSSSNSTLLLADRLRNTHNSHPPKECDSCSLRGFAPSRDKKKISREVAKARRNPRQTFSSNSTIPMAEGQRNTHNSHPPKERVSCSLRGFA
jgi:hypothetical protein